MTDQSAVSSLVEVQVEPGFIRFDGDKEEKYIFNYKVTITNRNKNNIQLVSRAWIITDGKAGTGITIASGVTNVIKVFNLSDASGSSSNMFNFDYQMHLNDMFSLGYMGSLLEYSMAQQYLSTLDLVIDSDNKFTSFF